MELPDGWTAVVQEGPGPFVTRARLLKPGTMVVSQPSIPVPLVVDFPFPPWATRPEEVDDAGHDPFDGV